MKPSIAFHCGRIDTQQIVRSVYFPVHLLPISTTDNELPLLSSVDHCDPSSFGALDKLALKQELQLLQQRYPDGFEQLQAAIDLIDECLADTNSFVDVTPF